MTSETQHSPARRSLLKGSFRHEEVLRPPGSVAPGHFEELCKHCGDCAAVCPQAIITSDPEGFPIVDLSARACDFCNACAEACKPGAILPASGWDMRAQVTESCLALQGVMCRTCEDHCDERAIRFQIHLGGRSEPVIDQDACSGCGACIAPCPAHAISLQRLGAMSEGETDPNCSQPQKSEPRHHV